MWTVTLRGGKWIKVDGWTVEGGALVIWMPDKEGVLRSHSAYAIGEWLKVEFTIP